MTASLVFFRGLAVLFLCATPYAVSIHAQSDFSASLNKGGLTSAGIFDSNGNIVRTLWALETFNAGKVSGSWDELDDFGTPVPPGSYSWKVLRNDAQYNNIGVIGNTGLPPYTSGHVPFLIEGVAVDAQGRAYTVHDWDEAHFDVIRWSPTDGKSEMNTGHAIGEALLKAIAVEPDGSFAYVTGYADSLTDRTKSKLSIWRISMAPGLGENQRVINFTQQGRCIKAYDGNSGGYPSAGYPTPAYPANASEADKEVMAVSLISIAVQGSSLYVTDAIGGRILKYDKVSGNHQATITGVPVACGIALDSNGNIWVGHEHTKVSVYSPAGGRMGTPITDLTEVRALSIQGNVLAVADRVGKVRKYTITTGTQLNQQQDIYGLPQRPGDRKPERLSSINGMALDASGNILISDRLGDGSRLQKIDSRGSPVWQQMCLEVSASAAYGKADPDLLISSYRKAYQIDKALGKWTLLGTARTEAPKTYFGNYESAHLGPPRIVRFGSNDFFYFPAGDSVAIYRIEPAVDAERGPTLKLASVLGSSQPSPDGVHREETWRPENKYLWEWNDTQGDGAIQYAPRTTPGQAGEVSLLGLPGIPHPDWQWVRRAFEVDDAGWLWMASANRDHIPDVSYPFEGESLYAIPPQGLNSLGNPIYRWSAAVKVMNADTGRNALGLASGEGFEWKMTGRADDGLVYALAWSNKAGLPQDGSAWMGGNVLFGFQQSDLLNPKMLGAPKWRVALPKQSVGMVPIPGGPGGVLVGIDPGRGTVGHYTKEGLLIGSMKTTPAFSDPKSGPWVVGALDAHLAVNCNRDPRDSIIDVFVEDNLNQRIVWYRVNDTNIQTISTGSLNVSGSGGIGNILTVINGTGDGKYPAGRRVNLAATAPPTNKTFVAWTGNTAGVADVNSPNTTLAMPDSAVTLTATYKWASGNDKIRFYPDPTQEHQMVTSVWEGTNGDKDAGPYEVFYQPDTAAQAGWNEAMVDTKGFRYLRWRQTAGNGLIRELEWYRSGNVVKLPGPFFGTSGSWGNNPNLTWDKAVDGSTSTGFNGPDVNQPGWISPYIGVDSRPGAHTLTVNSGTGTGSYDTGTTVLVSANSPAPGQHFSAWEGDTPILSNRFLETTSAMMPSRDVAITATYGAAGAYKLTVSNGNGGGSYQSGTKVSVSANTPPVGQAFAGWIGDAGILDDAAAASTSARIPARDVAIEATFSASAPGTGLRGQYYNDGTSASYSPLIPFTSSPVLTRTDPTVDFDWGENSPGSPVTANNFSVKWTGQVKAPASGSYTFAVTGDDGVRMFLNGTQVIEGWKNQGATTYTSQPTTLTAGTLYNIELHYYEAGGGAVCRLHWSYPGQPDQAIPQSSLYPPEGRDQTVAPVFSPVAGTYTGAQYVTITSSTADAIIRYTTNGSTPTASTGILYNGPVPVGSTMTLKAVAYKTGMDDSAVTSGTYTINVVPVYTLTVINGTGSGSYEEGKPVNVSANPPPSGQVFGGWIDQASILASQSASTTTAKMPGQNASITATYTAKGALTREVWTGVTGVSVSRIPVGTAPNLTTTLTSFEAPTNWANSYGTRVRGYITAPATGDYRFWIASDDASELRLSTDSNPANKRRIAWVTGWTNSRQWTKESNQRSTTIPLLQGLRYYVEALQKEGTGGDNLAVGWAKPGQSTSAPSEIIPGTVLSPFP